MLQLTIENEEPKKKKEAWNDIDHAYKKALKNISKIKGLERWKELWLQEHETRNQTMEKLTVQILQMKNMIAGEEFHRQKVEKDKEQVVIKVNELGQEMVKTNLKLDDLVEKNKDLDPTYVNNKLEEYNDLVQYYSILHTKQQMDDVNVDPDEWWGLAKTQFQEEMQKNLVAHKRDEAAYNRRLFTFKKAFLNFIYHSSKSSSPIEEVEEVDCNGAIKEKQLEEPQNLKGRGQNIPSMVVEEQAQLASWQEI